MGKKQKLNIDQLLLSSLYSLINKKISTTFENLVAESYQLFPKEFGLKGYIEKYPDSSRIDKCWRRCRTDRRWISGSVAHGFSITSHGIEELKKINRVLNIKEQNYDEVQHGDKRTKSGRIIDRIEKHSSFINYRKYGDKAEISDYEICDLLFTTLDSFPETRRKNINEMKSLVITYKRIDILNFLEWIEESKNYLFNK